MILPRTVNVLCFNIENVFSASHAKVVHAKVTKFCQRNISELNSPFSYLYLLTSGERCSGFAAWCSAVQDLWCLKYRRCTRPTSWRSPPLTSSAGRTWDSSEEVVLNKSGWRGEPFRDSTGRVEGMSSFVHKCNLKSSKQPGPVVDVIKLLWRNSRKSRFPQSRNSKNMPFRSLKIAALFFHFCAGLDIRKIFYPFLNFGEILQISSKKVL